jgi:hypothetical protein
MIYMSRDGLVESPNHYRITLWDPKKWLRRGPALTGKVSPPSHLNKYTNMYGGTVMLSDIIKSHPLPITSLW